MTDNNLQTNLIQLCLHPKKVRSKQVANSIAGRIVNEIVNYENSYSVDYFFKSITQGQTWCGGLFDKKSKKAINWLSQQVFAIDVDNKDDNVTPNDLYLLFKGLGYPPNMFYHSLSSTPEKNKFRLIWLTSELVTDPKIAMGFKRWLIKMSEGAADPACINLDRLYFGGLDGELYHKSKLDVNSLPFIEAQHTTETQVLMSDTVEDPELFRFARDTVARAMAAPERSKWGSRHQTIFKGSIFLIKASNGSKNVDWVYKFIKMHMDDNPEVWDCYDRDDETVRQWIDRAFVWTLGNILNGEVV